MKFKKAIVVNALCIYVFCLNAMRVAGPVRSLSVMGQRKTPDIIKKTYKENLYKYEEPLIEISKSNVKKSLEKGILEQENRLKKEESKIPASRLTAYEKVPRTLLAGLSWQNISTFEVDQEIKTAVLEIKNPISTDNNRWQLLVKLIKAAFPPFTIVEKPLSQYLRAQALNALADIFTQDVTTKKFIDLKLHEEQTTYESKFGIHEYQITPRNLYEEILKLPSQGIVPLQKIALEKLLTMGKSHKEIQVKNRKTNA